MLRYKEIFLGGRCNNNCLHCSAGHKESAQTDFNQIAESLNKNDEGNVSFYGGEPLLRNDLPEIISAARSNHYKRIRLITNGRAFSDVRLLQQVIAAGCRLFEIKLWGSNPALHDHLTRVPGSFWETVNGLENLAGFGDDKFVCVRIPVCHENYVDVENVTVAAMNFGVNRVILSMEDRALSFGSVLPHIRNAINIGIFNRVWIMTEGVPLCAGQIPEVHVSEIYSGWEATYERAFQRHRYCGDCAYRELCPGVDSRYLRQFGEKELSPVRTNRYTDDIKALYA